MIILFTAMNLTNSVVILLKYSENSLLHLTCSHSVIHIEVVLKMYQKERKPTSLKMIIIEKCATCFRQNSVPLRYSEIRMRSVRVVKTNNVYQSNDSSLITGNGVMVNGIVTGNGSPLLNLCNYEQYISAPSLGRFLILCLCKPHYWAM